MYPIFRLSTAAALLALAVSPGGARGETNMLFILDGSNSMWGQIEGVPKITTAQDVLATLLDDLPKDTKVGLMVYGHLDKSSCTDIELLSPIGGDSAETLAAKVKGVKPKGKTPIAGALAASAAAFAQTIGQNNNVVLISDGLETCDGDPCAAAAALNTANIQARVHVIGFDVGAEERRQLECIPAAGKGRYFSAGNAGELKAAVAEVKKVAAVVEQKPEPPKPPKPQLREVFRDEFDGDNLADHWEVVNPDPDAFIVENGKLLAVAAANSPALSSGEAANLFKLTEPLPKADWVLSASFDVDFQTAAEAPFLGIVEDGKDYMVVQPMAVPCGNWGNRLCFGIEAIKSSGGKITRFEKWLIHEQGFENFVYDEAAAATIPQPVELRIVKKGRTYQPGIAWSTIDESTKKPVRTWVDLEVFTVLRLKGKPAVGVYQKSATPGESAAEVDWVRIQVPEE